MHQFMRTAPCLLFLALACVSFSIDAASAVPQAADGSPPIHTAKDAEIRVRNLYFDEDYGAGAVEGARLVERFPESTQLRAWTLLNDARQFTRDDAKREATALTIERPSDPWSWFALAATSLFDPEHLSDGVKLSGKTLAMAPDHPDFLWLRAMALLYGRTPAQAMDFVAQAVPKVANPANLLTVRGDAILGLDETEGVNTSPFILAAALEEYQRARRTDSHCVMAYTSAAVAISYYRRKPQEALPLMEQAVEIAPCSLDVHRQFWAIMRNIPEMDGKENQARVEADIQTLLNCRGSDPAVLRAVANQYGYMKLASKRLQYQDRVLRDYPDSIAAEYVAMDRWRALAAEQAEEGRKGPEAAAALRPQIQDFINRPRHLAPGALGEAYMRLFFSLRDDPASTGDELLKAVDGMAVYMKGNWPIVYVKGPTALADRGAHLDRAEELVLEGIAKSEERREKTRHQSGASRADRRSWDRQHQAEQLDALGWVHLMEGRVEEARRELVRASELAPPTAENLFHLGRLSETEGNPARAQEFYAEGLLVQTPDENPSEKGLKDLYIKLNGSDAGYENFRAQFQERATEERKSKILAERVTNPQPLAAFDLKSLDGRRVSSAEVSGKILVVNFWGLWCGWCLEEMPDLQKLHEKYRNDSRVAILTIDTGDDPAKVGEWMKQRGYDFPVLLDDGYVARMGIEAFPTTWFVDAQGRKAFTLVDWSKWLVEEYGWRIEALKNDGG